MVVERADGTKVAEIPLVCGNCESNARSVLALSPDGRYVAIGGWPTTGERADSWGEILDTRTGKVALDPSPPLSPTTGRFLADGRFILLDGETLKLMRVDGTVVDTITMPEALRFRQASSPYRSPRLLLVK